MRKPLRQEGTEDGAAAAAVLVIDDSDVARRAMAELLTQNGIKVVTLASPIGATREVMRSNVDVVVIDLMMPGLRGDRLAVLFRENPRLAKLGLILVSGGNEEELSQISLERSIDAVVSKSRIHELPAAVQRVRRLSVGRGL